MVILYAAGVTLVDAVLGLLTPREHRHVERVPSAGAVVVVSDHLSVSDPLVLASALRRAGRRGTPARPRRTSPRPGVAQWGAHRLVTREGTSSHARPLRWLGRFRPGRLARRPTVLVLVGEPITPTQLRARVPDPEDLRAMTAVVMDELRRLLAEIAAEDLPDLAH